MGKVFETQEDKAREAETLNSLALSKGISYELMPKGCPVDAKLFKNGNLLAYAEVKSYKRNFADTKDQVCVALRKIAYLQKFSVEKGVPCCVIYKFNDAIGYYFLSEINNAQCAWGGRNKIREGSNYDRELMIYFPKSALKLI